MPRKLISAQPPFTMLVANLAGGSDPSRGRSGNPVKVRKSFTFQHFPEIPQRGADTTPQSLDTPGIGTRWGHVSYTVPETPVGATGTVTVASNSFAGPTTVRIGQYAVTTGDDFAVGANVSATGTVTVVAAPSAATLTIGGVALTPAGGARTPGANDYDNTLGTVALIAAEITAAINDGANGFVGIAVALAPGGGLVDLTAVPAGAAGNAVTLASNHASVTVSGVALSGGLDPDESTASNLASAVNHLMGYSAVAAGNVVTVTGITGPLGNEVLFASTGSSPNNFVFSPDNLRMSGAEPAIGPPIIA